MTSSAPPPLDLNNVQGDILAGLPKKTQTYFFFLIDQSRTQEFRKQLAHLVPLITTTAQVFKHHDAISQDKADAARRGLPRPLLKISGVNIVFSQKGLVKIGIDTKGEINDSAFVGGMLADAKDLGDPGTATADTPDWVPAFKHGVDGMVLVSGDSHQTVAEKLSEIENIFLVGAHSATIHEALRIVGDVRPGKENGHEHFGFQDGISQPAIRGVNATANPGQEFVNQGVTLLGREGDDSIVLENGKFVNQGPVTRPPWALDGSFLAFRYLFQLVPEFNTFLKQNPIPGLAPELGSELLGARLMGRWKSGAPIDITPTKDDPILGKDASRNNNFRYALPGHPETQDNTQDRCPFAAHTRKTNPRADLEDLSPSVPTDNRRIIRRGIQFGPEVSAAEAAAGKTIQGRGLLFAAYQSNIVNGFQFIQKSWADNANFPPKAVTAGLDPIVGQDAGGARSMIGTNPNSQSTSLSLPTWVVPRGGEYFFSPSIAALKETFALA